MNVLDFPQIRDLMALHKPVFNLFDLRVGSVDSVETDLVSKQPFGLDLVYDHLKNGRDLRPTDLVVASRYIIADASVGGEI